MADGTSIEWTDELRRRFWANVDKSGPVAPGMTTPCWIWTAGAFSNGYGQFRVGAKKVRAHRAAYELVRGPLPPGELACHRCDVKLCVRAEPGDGGHLFAGTHADNAADREAKGRGARHSGVSLPGEANPAAKLTAEAVARLRALRLHASWSYRRLAEAFGISRSQARNIVQGRSWGNDSKDRTLPEVTRG